jgi:DNA invertase Pin-like site-specific DNA recombinase
LKSFIDFLSRAGKLNLWLSTAEIAYARGITREQVRRRLEVARQRYGLPIERRGVQPHFEFKVRG